MRRRYWGLIGIFVLALVLRLGLAAIWYTDDLSRFESGDYALYRIGAEHLLSSDDFSNSLFLVRPPLFPIIIALFNVNNGLVLLFNIVAGALVAPLTVILTRRLQLVASAAWAAGLIVALDPPSIIYSAFLGPEPLANLCLLASMIALLASLQANQNRTHLIYGALAGVCLVLSMAARPAAYLLWIPLGLWLFIQYRRLWRPVLLFAAICFAWVAVWTIHNAQAFANPTYSTIGAYNTLYYRAAAVERFATDADIDLVYTRLSEAVETRLGNLDVVVDADRRFHHYTPNSTQQNAIIATAIDVFRAHPVQYVALIPVGLWRMFVETDALSGFPLIVAMIWNIALVVGTGVGLYVALRQRNWLVFWCVLLVTVYFTAGTLLVQTSGMDSRMHTMLTPLMATTCAYGVLNWNRLRTA